MIGFIKDILAFVSISGFSIAAVTWLDIISHLS